jgi:hypothetical protein
MRPYAWQHPLNCPHLTEHVKEVLAVHRIFPDQLTAITARRHIVVRTTEFEENGSSHGADPANATMLDLPPCSPRAISLRPLSPCLRPYPRNRKNGSVTRPSAKSMPNTLITTRTGSVRSNVMNVSAVPARLAAAYSARARVARCCW